VFFATAVLLFGSVPATVVRAAQLLNGSDSLYDVVQTVISSCANSFGTFSGASYEGGGATVGALQMQAALQKISPMTRPLEASEYCADSTVAMSGGASPLLTEALLIGLDGVSVVANETNSCSTTTANGLGGIQFQVTSNGTPTGGVPASCPGCSAGNLYTFGDPTGSLYAGRPSFDALAVLYFGLMHDGTYDCGNPVRRSLIANWRNIFATDCLGGDATCTSGLTHAWRLGDLSGGTDALVSVLGPPARGIGTAGPVAVGIGTLETAPVYAAKLANPFCNSFDANNVGSTSFAGSSDYQDLDPIRTICGASGQRDNVCEAYKNFGTSGLFLGDLGVVLPIVFPDSPVVQASDVYPLQFCSQSCTLIAPAKSSFIPPNFTCPESGLAPIQGFCFMPDLPGTTDPRCVSTSTNKCFDVIGKPDGRQYNRAIVVAQSQFTGTYQKYKQPGSPFQMAIDANGRIMNGAFFRIHAETAGANNVPNPSAGTTGLCTQTSDSAQVGCLVDSDPCSVGYAARSAAAFFPGLGGPPPSAPLKALAIDGVPPFTPGADPNLAIENLLHSPGTVPFYPLSRRLYLNTIYGFGNLDPTEADLYSCFANGTVMSSILPLYGFVPIPAGPQCLNYPSNLSTTSTPAPNTQGPGNVALGGCGLGLGVRTMCP
jgi:hypothetical protein